MTVSGATSQPQQQTTTTTTIVQPFGLSSVLSVPHQPVRRLSGSYSALYSNNNNNNQQQGGHHTPLMIPTDGAGYNSTRSSFQADSPQHADQPPSRLTLREGWSGFLRGGSVTAATGGPHYSARGSGTTTTTTVLHPHGTPLFLGGNAPHHHHEDDSPSVSVIEMHPLQSSFVVGNGPYSFLPTNAAAAAAAGKRWSRSVRVSGDQRPTTPVVGGSSNRPSVGSWFDNSSNAAGASSPHVVPRSPVGRHSQAGFAFGSSSVAEQRHESPARGRTNKARNSWLDEHSTGGGNSIGAVPVAYNNNRLPQVLAIGTGSAASGTAAPASGGAVVNPLVVPRGSAAMPNTFSVQISSPHNNNGDNGGDMKEPELELCKLQTTSSSSKPAAGDIVVVGLAPTSGSPVFRIPQRFGSLDEEGAADATHQDRAAAFSEWTCSDSASSDSGASDDDAQSGAFGPSMSLFAAAGPHGDSRPSFAASQRSTGTTRRRRKVSHDEDDDNTDGLGGRIGMVAKRSQRAVAGFVRSLFFFGSSASPMNHNNNGNTSRADHNSNSPPPAATTTTPENAAGGSGAVSPRESVFSRTSFSPSTQALGNHHELPLPTNEGGTRRGRRRTNKSRRSTAATGNVKRRATTAATGCGSEERDGWNGIEDFVTSTAILPFVALLLLGIIFAIVSEWPLYNMAFRTLHRSDEGDGLDPLRVDPAVRQWAHAATTYSMLQLWSAMERTVGMFAQTVPQVDNATCRFGRPAADGSMVILCRANQSAAAASSWNISSNSVSSSLAAPPPWGQSYTAPRSLTPDERVQVSVVSFVGPVSNATVVQNCSVVGGAAWDPLHFTGGSGSGGDLWRPVIVPAVSFLGARGTAALLGEPPSSDANHQDDGPFPLTITFVSSDAHRTLASSSCAIEPLSAAQDRSNVADLVLESRAARLGILCLVYAVALCFLTSLWYLLGVFTKPTEYFRATFEYVAQSAKQLSTMSAVSSSVLSSPTFLSNDPQKTTNAMNQNTALACLGKPVDANYFRLVVPYVAAKQEEYRTFLPHHFAVGGRSIVSGGPGHSAIFKALGGGAGGPVPLTAHVTVPPQSPRSGGDGSPIMMGMRSLQRRLSGAETAVSFKVDPAELAAASGVGGGGLPTFVALIQESGQFTLESVAQQQQQQQQPSLQQQHSLSVGGGMLGASPSTGVFGTALADEPPVNLNEYHDLLAVSHAVNRTSIQIENPSPPVEHLVVECGKNGSFAMSPTARGLPTPVAGSGTARRHFPPPSQRGGGLAVHTFETVADFPFASPNVAALMTGGSVPPPPSIAVDSGSMQDSGKDDLPVAQHTAQFASSEARISSVSPRSTTRLQSTAHPRRTSALVDDNSPQNVSLQQLLKDQGFSGSFDPLSPQRGRMLGGSGGPLGGGPHGTSSAAASMMVDTFPTSIVDTSGWSYIAPRRVSFVVCQLFFGPTNSRSVPREEVQNKDRLHVYHNLAQSFHEHIQRVAQEFTGTIYAISMSSCVIAWNAFEPYPFHEARSCFAALHLAKELQEEFDTDRQVLSSGVRWGLCVNSGAVVVGVVGTERKMSPVMHGDALTIAQATVGLAPIIRCAVLVLEPCYMVSRTQIFCIPVDIVGRDEAKLIVFELKGQLVEFRSHEHEFQPAMDGFACMAVHKFDEAIALFSSCLGVDHNVYRLMQLTQLLQDLRATAPDLIPKPYHRLVPSWDSPEILADQEDLQEDLTERLASSSVMTPQVATIARSRFPSLLPELLLRAQFDRQASFDMAQSGTNLLGASTTGPGGLLIASDQWARDSLRESATVTPYRSRAGSGSFSQTMFVGEGVMGGSPPQSRRASSQQQTKVTPTIPVEVRDRRGNTWWRTDKILGRGSFGVVYQGLAENGSLVALKLLPLNATERTLIRQSLASGGGGGGKASALTAPGCSSQIEDVLKEITLLSQLQQANIVQYLSSCLAGGFLVIVLEFMPGGSLTRIVQTFGGLPQAVIRRYSKDILEGLRFLHSKQLVHRDINPNNVLLTIDGTCKLSDFGAAGGSLQRAVAACAAAVRRTSVDSGGSGGTATARSSFSVEGGGHLSTSSDSTRTASPLPTGAAARQVFGTPLFMAPEACRGLASQSSDIWGFGIMLCYCFSGTYPYREEDYADDVEGFLRRLATEADYGPTIPRSLITSRAALQVIESCLERDEAKRPTASELLLSPFLIL